MQLFTIGAIACWSLFNLFLSVGTFKVLYEV